MYRLSLVNGENITLGEGNLEEFEDSVDTKELTAILRLHFLNQLPEQVSQAIAVVASKNVCEVSRVYKSKICKHEVARLSFKNTT